MGTCTLPEYYPQIWLLYEQKCCCCCRVRPQLAREKIDMCQVCISVSSDQPQITVGKDKAFTYDYVFDMETKQDAIYNTCVRGLIDG